MTSREPAPIFVRFRVKFRLRVWEWTCTRCRPMPNVTFGYGLTLATAADAGRKHLRDAHPAGDVIHRITEVEAERDELRRAVERVTKLRDEWEAAKGRADVEYLARTKISRLTACESAALMLRAALDGAEGGADRG